MAFFQLFHSPDFLAQALIVVCLAAAITALAIPYIASDPLQKRMKLATLEREHMRLREHEKTGGSIRAGLRLKEKPFVHDIVKRLRLTEWLGIKNAPVKLAEAGFRGFAAESTFIFYRAVAAVFLFLIGFFYLFFIDDMGFSYPSRIAALISLLYVGIKIPEIYLYHVTSERRESIRRAFPDAIDLLLICVESGASIESAFRRVSEEIGHQSVALKEEFILTTAELSFLPDRCQAYENLGRRVNVDTVRQIVTVLNQADRYGTSLGEALRVAAQESRAARMAEAERKAAALPPKLSIPLVLFFMPVLLVVVLGPPLIQASKSFF